MIKKLFPCVSGYKLYSILAPLTIIIEVLLEVFIPYIMSIIIDKGIPSGNIGYILSLGGLMVLMALFSLVFGALSGIFAARASTGFASNVRKKIFDKIQDFTFNNIDKYSTASLITRLTTDVNNAQMAYMIVIRMLVRAPFMLISATVMAFSINAQLALLFVFAIPILGVTMFTLMGKAFPRFKYMFTRFDKMNGVVQENLISIRTVKAYVRENYETEKFNQISQEVQDAHVNAEKILLFNMPIMQFVMYACIIAIVVFGGSLIIGGTMKIGELTSFITYSTQILMSLMMLSMSFVMLVIAKASLNRIIEVFDEVIDIKDDDAGSTITVEDGSIEFNNVSFGYGSKEDNMVLKDVNLHIPSGITVGIIGATGSAKSTLVQLIPRLYDVTTGEIKVGGHNIKNYKLDTLRSAVSMVLQKNVLFSGTIRNNLMWGKMDASEEDMIKAAKDAEAHNFIMDFKDGYETVLGQGGVNVSGGQKQRLCIARALLAGPKVLILDDSTSAIDTATDSRIRTTLSKIKGITLIIIAQRIASIENSDMIVIMNEGKIITTGSHEYLLKESAIYREVYESQRGVE